MKIKSLIICILVSTLIIQPCVGQSDTPAQNISQKEVKLLIDSISSVLNRLYIYPEKAVIMAKKLKGNEKTSAYLRYRNKADLGEKLTKDLQLANKDVHLKVGYFPDGAKDKETRKSEAEEKEARQSRLVHSRENRFEFIKKEILPGNIGYLRWDFFDEFVEEALPLFDSAFQFVSKSNTLIIDMRYNTGGNPNMVYALQSYFFERRTGMNHIIDRFNDTVKRVTIPSKTKFKLNMPVYILTSPVTGSAAEDFTYGMQQSKRATCIGGVTWGGAHPINVCSLGQGFIMSIPTLRSSNAFSKTDWEGTGIVPDLETTSEEALQEALLIIYLKLQSKLKGDEAKKGIQQYINEIKNGKYAVIPFSTLKNNDAPNAIEIKDSIYGPTNICRGLGSVQEYHEKTTFKDHGKFIYMNEENSAWFKLQFDRDTILTFDLVPIDPSNDYDFILFKCPDNTCIENIRTGKIKPDRSCNSGFASYNGSTGLSLYAASERVGLGAGPTYASALPVKAGELYYLMVLYADYYIQQSNTSYGFTLYFHDYWSKKKPLVIDNVTFNSNEAVILSESFAELEKLALQLIKNKSMNIEIRGHADNQGNEEKNRELSVQRAQAVKDYLVSRHIDAKRILCKGFGSSKPIASNETEEGKKKNRQGRVRCNNAVDGFYKMNYFIAAQKKYHCIIILEDKHTVRHLCKTNFRNKIYQTSKQTVQGALTITAPTGHWADSVIAARN